MQSRSEKRPVVKILVARREYEPLVVDALKCIFYGKVDVEAIPAEWMPFDVYIILPFDIGEVTSLPRLVYIAATRYVTREYTEESRDYCRRSFESLCGDRRLRSEYPLFCEAYARDAHMV